MNFTIPTRIAQILFAVPFAFFGISHLMAGNNMAGMVPIPGGAFWVYLTGVVQLLAAIAFVINFKVRLAAYLIGLYLLIVILTIHVPGTMNGVAGESMMLVKDIGLLAGAILLGNHFAAERRVVSPV
jgi:uncharacterized membrane protein YphA (DoxX/SURF4 family)